MRPPRTMMPHCALNADGIDSFQCSRCEWSYRLSVREPFLIAYEDADRACRAFNEHHCEEFKARKTARTTPDGSSGRSSTRYEQYLLELGFTREVRENSEGRQRRDAGAIRNQRRRSIA